VANRRVVVSSIVKEGFIRVDFNLQHSAWSIPRQASIEKPCRPDAKTALSSLLYGIFPKLFLKIGSLEWPPHASFSTLFPPELSAQLVNEGGTD
jgi:hypothetical protein